MKHLLMACLLLVCCVALALAQDYDYTDTPTTDPADPISDVVELEPIVVTAPYPGGSSDLPDYLDSLNPPANQGQALDPGQQGAAIHAARSAYRDTQQGTLNLASWLAAGANLGYGPGFMDLVVNEILALQQGSTTWQGVTPVKKSSFLPWGINGYYLKDNGHADFRITVKPHSGQTCRDVLRGNYPVFKTCRKYSVRYPRTQGGLVTFYRLSTAESKFYAWQYSVPGYAGGTWMNESQQIQGE